MNLSILCGRLSTVPQMSLIQMEGKSICACKYVIAVCDGLFDYSEAQMMNESNVDFFECIAFEDVAKMICHNFVKGSKMICMGKMKNHIFEDCNRTKHFTNVFLTQQAEFGDTEAAMSKLSDKKKPLEMLIVSDLKELDSIFKKICENGFLCINENDYYKIAMNM